LTEIEPIKVCLGGGHQSFVRLEAVCWAAFVDSEFVVLAVDVVARANETLISARRVEDLNHKNNTALGWFTFAAERPAELAH